MTSTAEPAARRWTPGRLVRLAVAGATIITATIAVAGCGSAPASTSSAAAASAVALAVSTVATASEPAAPTASAARPSASAALPVDRPPDALLNGVAGALGSFTWREAGSDSGWLPGSTLSIAGATPLAVNLGPPAPVGHWSARYAVGGRPDDTGAKGLAEGEGPLRPLPAPPIGRWTIELHVTFGDGLGDAVYFWDTEVH
jgi:hypothetical protein